MKENKQAISTPLGTNPSPNTSAPPAPGKHMAVRCDVLRYRDSITNILKIIEFPEILDFLSYDDKCFVLQVLKNELINESALALSYQEQYKFSNKEKTR